jgi:hypothetical protein
MFEEHTSFGFDAPRPSSDSEDLFSGSGAAWDVSPFAAKEPADMFGDFESAGIEDDAPFSAEPETMFGAPVPESKSPLEPNGDLKDNHGLVSKAPAFGELDLVDNGEDAFEDNDDEEIGWLDDLMPAETSSSAPALAIGGAAQPAYRPADFYRLIPGEIEAKPGGVSRRSWVLVGVVMLLAALNVVSIAMLAL